MDWFLWAIHICLVVGRCIRLGLNATYFITPLIFIKKGTNTHHASHDRMAYMRYRFNAVQYVKCIDMINYPATKLLYTGNQTAFWSSANK